MLNWAGLPPDTYRGLDGELFNRVNQSSVLSVRLPPQNSHALHMNQLRSRQQDLKKKGCQINAVHLTTFVLFKFDELIVFTQFLI